VDSDFVVFATGNKVMLVTDNGGAFPLMCFQDKAKFASLIPTMDGTVGTATIAETIFIKTGAIELCLCVFWSKCTILEKFLSCISWIPELQ